MPGPDPVLAVEGLTATPPGADGPVLRAADFRLGAGERVVLTGPSGSGKSTLLRCMVMLEPARGRVLFRGRPVTPDDVLELRRRVGYVPQRPVPIAGTIAENLAFPRDLRDGALDEPAQRALLATLGLAELRLDRRFDDLSGGEQQRVALVRSLTPRPDVLLLDEPTASLDPENVGAVVGVLRDWAEEDAGRAMVWVSHQTDPVDTLATGRITLADLQARREDPSSPAHEGDAS